eukprot:gene8141-8981_t
MLTNQIYSNFRDQWHLLGILIGFATFFILATFFYCQYENWTVTDSVFFMIVTLSTVGYGQPAPSDDNSRLFTIFVIIIGIFVIIVGVNDIIHNNLTIVRNFLCKNNKQAVAAGMEVGDIYHYRRQLFYNFFIFSLWIVIGAAVVKHNEDWSWTEGFYFIMETSSTVGYGDLHIKERSTKAFLCVYIIVSTIIIASMIKTFTLTLEENKQLRKAELRLTQLQSLDFLADETRSLNKHETIILLLTYLGQVDHAKDISPWLQKLSAISVEGNVPPDQLRHFIEREREEAQNHQRALELIKKRSGILYMFQHVFDCIFFRGHQSMDLIRQSTEGMEINEISVSTGTFSGSKKKKFSDDVESPLQGRHDEDA